MECVVRFMPSERSVRVPAGTSLLEAARAARLPVAQACMGGGACARCGMQVIAGGEALEEESGDERDVKSRNRVDPEMRLACRLTVSSDLTVRASYW